MKKLTSAVTVALAAAVLDAASTAAFAQAASTTQTEHKKKPKTSKAPQSMNAQSQ